MPKTLGVFIGRLQPPHAGHVQAIKQVLKECDHCLVLFGSSFQAPDTKNPFTFMERYAFVGNLLEVNERPRLRAAGLRDYPYSDIRWQLAVQKEVEGWKEALQCDKVRLYGHEKDSSSLYLRLFPQWERHGLDVLKLDEQAVSATNIRRILFEEKDDAVVAGALSHVCHPQTIETLLSWRGTSRGIWLAEEYSFEQKYIKAWENSPFPPTFQTVDNIVLWRGLVLLGKRKHRPGLGLWALPGGFLDVAKCETRRQAAVRELIEETKPQVFRPVKSGLIPIPLDENWIIRQQGFDHPYRSRRGRIFTEAFLWRIPDELEVVHKANDDLAKTKFFPLSEALENMGELLFEDHHAIIGEMTLRN